MPNGSLRLQGEALPAPLGLWPLGTLDVVCGTSGKLRVKARSPPMAAAEPLAHSVDVDQNVVGSALNAADAPALQLQPEVALTPGQRLLVGRPQAGAGQQRFDGANAIAGAEAVHPPEHPHQFAQHRQGNGHQLCLHSCCAQSNAHRAAPPHQAVGRGLRRDGPGAPCARSPGPC